MEEDTPIILPSSSDITRSFVSRVPSLYSPEPGKGCARLKNASLDYTHKRLDNVVLKSNKIYSARKGAIDERELISRHKRIHSAIIDDRRSAINSYRVMRKQKLEDVRKKLFFDK